MDISAASASSGSTPLDRRHAGEERIVKAAVRILDNWDQLDPESRRRLESLAKTVGENRKARIQAVREALPQLDETQREAIKDVFKQIHDLRAGRRQAIVDEFMSRG